MSRIEEEVVFDQKRNPPSEDEIRRIENYSFDQALASLGLSQHDGFGYVANLFPQEVVAYVHALQKSNKPVAVSFGAGWCSDCRDARDEGLDRFLGEKVNDGTIGSVLKVRVEQKSRQAIEEGINNYPMMLHWTAFNLAGGVPAVFIPDREGNFVNGVVFNNRQGVHDFMSRVRQLFEPTTQRQPRNLPPTT